MLPSALTHPKFFHSIPDQVTSTTLRKPQWNDPRVIVSIFIMLITMSVGYWAWNSMGATTHLYMVTRDVAPGEELIAGDTLTVVDSHPGTPEGTYIGIGDLPDGALALHSISAGELLPRTAVTKETEMGRKAVVLSITAPVPSQTRVGSEVDVWQLPDPSLAHSSTSDSSPSAQPVAHHVIVSSISKEQNSMIGGGSSSVEVMVSDQDLPHVLTALGQRGDLLLVPSGIQP
ncbi:hypothetical protein [Actinomyces vulturis]|uniref:hypothetical protein n=1 Tax=Actinomyces vulturis TaxID=1857645 RepID=UPI00082D1D25|nr:hypothetical protein [Actinomyces vulturis]